MSIIKLKSLLVEVTLYHGTTIDNIDSIRKIGLIPMRGDFVTNAYGGEYESEDDFENSIPELTFAASKRQLDKAVSAATHHIAKKLDKGFHDVTDEDFIRYAAIVKIYDGDKDFLHHTGEKYVDYPMSVEPDDYYSEDGASADEILTGKKMVNFLRKYKLWPRTYGDIVGTTTKNYMRDFLIKLFIKRNNPKQKVLDVIMALNDKDLEYQYNKYHRP